MKRLIKQAATIGMAAVLCASPMSVSWCQIVKAEEQTTEEAEVKTIWDFMEDAQGWTYDDSWSGGAYHGEGSCEYDAGKQMLKTSLDFSKDQENGWCQTGISLWNEEGIDFSECTDLKFDLYFDPASLTTGDLTIKAAADEVFNEQMSSISSLASEDAEDGLKKVTFQLKCDKVKAAEQKPQKLLLLIVGNSTDFKGDLWFDNIALTKSVEPDPYVDTTTAPATETIVELAETEISINDSKAALESELTLTDAKADASVIALYQYLKAVGESEAVLYGHMEDTVLKAGSVEGTYSDTEDMTGSLAALDGLDCGNLFDGFAAKYNSRNGSALEETTEGNITAAANFTNESAEKGALMTLSCHMPNFAFAEELETDSEKPYDHYDYLKADSYNLTGDCMNEILPGGKYHAAFTAYLDMIAEYASQVKAPILFRPFHENTGSWFWWGKAFCDAETYKSVYKFTVEYLRDEKNVHNLLYLYGPGSEAASLEEYEDRYPGDAYVDLVGFDAYDNDPVTDEEGYAFQTNFENTVRLTSEFAQKHGKLFAVTETGISSSSGCALLRTGNKRPQWYSEILDIVSKPEYKCCYFLLWSNYSKDGNYYTPYVEKVNEDGTLHGHELLDSFISFYNDKRSIFALDQKAVMEKIVNGDAKGVVVTSNDDLKGYLTAPIAGRRILAETVLGARISKSAEELHFVADGNEKQMEIPAEIDGKSVSGVLTEEMLAEIGEDANGRIGLYAGETLLHEIPVMFNVEEKVNGPELVDDFENYYGIPELLTASWAVNKDSGCELTLTPSEEAFYNGKYAMKFEYKETKNGWAGATIAKEEDWSAYNALSFWVLPDGKNQKTVVQINTADGGFYEAYLNTYEEYVNAEGPLLVTLPFAEFVDKGDRGSLTSEAAASLSSVGLWLNAIPDSDAIEDDMVSGALYYDEVKAVASESDQPVFENAQSGAENTEE